MECDLEDVAFIAVFPTCRFLLPFVIASNKPFIPFETINLISWIYIPLVLLSRIGKRLSYSLPKRSLI